MESLTRVGSFRTIHKVVANNDHVQIQKLLDEGVDIDLIDAAGKTCLHLAVRARSVETTAILLKHGCDLTIIDNSGMMPFQLLTKHLNPQVADAIGSDKWEWGFLHFKNDFQQFLGCLPKPTQEDSTENTINEFELQSILSANTYEESYELLPKPQVQGTFLSKTFFQAVKQSEQIKKSSTSVDVSLKNFRESCNVQFSSDKNDKNSSSSTNVTSSSPNPPVVSRTASLSRKGLGGSFKAKDSINVLNKTRLRLTFSYLTIYDPEIECDLIADGLLKAIPLHETIEKSQINWIGGSIRQYDMLRCTPPSGQSLLLKPLGSFGSGLNEINFYSKITSTYVSLAPYTPCYYGIVQIGIFLWIVIQDITSLSVSPSIMDIKIGKHLFPPSLSKVEQQIGLLQTQEQLGFGIQSIHVRSNDNNNNDSSSSSSSSSSLLLGQSFVSHLTTKDVFIAFSRFFTPPNRSTNMEIVNLLNVKLKILESSLTNFFNENSCSLYGSSIFLIYDYTTLTNEVKLFDFRYFSSDIADSDHCMFLFGIANILNEIKNHILDNKA